MTLRDLYPDGRLYSEMETTIMSGGGSRGGRWEERNERVRRVGTEDGWVWSRYQG